MAGAGAQSLRCACGEIHYVLGPWGILHPEQLGIPAVIGHCHAGLDRAGWDLAHERAMEPSAVFDTFDTNGIFAPL